jgi:hypothetical protein
MSSQVFYPSLDGYAARVNGAGEDFSVMRSGNGTVANDSNNYVYGYIDSDTITDKYDIFSRGIIYFDISSIGTGNTITAVTVSVMPIDNIFNGFSGYINFVQGATASDSVIAASDYQLNTYTTKFTNDVSTSQTLDTYTNYIFNAAGIAYVSGQQGGIVRLCMKSVFDIDNSPPTWSSGIRDGIQGASSENTGTSKDPKITLTYTEPVASENNIIGIL